MVVSNSYNRSNGLLAPKKSIQISLNWYRPLSLFSPIGAKVRTMAIRRNIYLNPDKNHPVKGKKLDRLQKWSRPIYVSSMKILLVRFDGNHIRSNSSNLRTRYNRLVGPNAKHPFSPDRNLFDQALWAHREVVQPSNHDAFSINNL